MCIALYSIDNINPNEFFMILLLQNLSVPVRLLKGKEHVHYKRKLLLPVLKEVKL
jgi:hypothetical protein